MSEKKGPAQYLTRLEKRREKKLHRYRFLLVDLKDKWNEFFDFTHSLAVNRILMYKSGISHAGISFQKKEDIDLELKAKEFGLESQSDLLDIIIDTIFIGHEIINESIHPEREIESDKKKLVSQEELDQFHEVLKNHKLFNYIVIEEERLLRSIDSIKSRSLLLQASGKDIQIFQVQINTLDLDRNLESLNLELSEDDIKFLISELQQVIKE